MCRGWVPIISKRNVLTGIAFRTLLSSCVCVCVFFFFGGGGSLGPGGVWEALGWLVWD